MGLDMYLNKHTYIGANYEHRNVTGKIELTQGVDSKPVNIKLNRVSEISEQVAYWRKANQIHNWFVKNVQSGDDDCGDYFVSKEQLTELVNDCKKVLADKGKAVEVMPTKSGFFFGGTEVDEYYFSDLEDTIKMVEPLLEEEGGSFYYTSSW